jgi:hypothetical protein
MSNQQRNNSKEINMQYITKLIKHDLSLIIIKNGRILFESRGEGIRPLMEALRRFGRTGLRRTVVVDKIVGKAAALIIAYFKPSELHCKTLSIRAKTIIQRHNIVFIAEEVTPEILSKSGDNICPFEKEVIEVENPLEGYRVLSMKVRNIFGL